MSREHMHPATNLRSDLSVSELQSDSPQGLQQYYWCYSLQYVSCCVESHAG